MQRGRPAHGLPQPAAGAPPATWVGRASSPPHRGQDARAILVWSGALLLVAAACPSASQTTAPATEGGAPERVIALGRLQDPRLRETSGLAASRRHPGLYYVHNDSGDRPCVYMIDRAGNTRATIELLDAQHVDYEDIALAPGKVPGTWDICVGDIGDNQAGREQVVIYRFPEPDLPPENPATIRIRPRHLRLRYEDGPRNAEGLAVHPLSGDIYIFSKRPDGACEVYKLPAGAQGDGPVTVRRVATLRWEAEIPLATIVTAADIAPDGRRLATRSYLCGWEWTLPPDAPVAEFERIFALRPVRIALPPEPQGEALGYDAEGTALLTVSEGVGSTLYELRRRPSE